MNLRALPQANALLLVLTLTACQTTAERAPSEPATLTPASTASQTPALALDTNKPNPDTPAPDAAVVDDVMDSGAEVFDRLTMQLSSPTCSNDPRDRMWRKRYAGHPDTFARHLASILPLLAHVTQAVEQAELPGEFALIPLVESGYAPAAVAPGGPTGLWQFIASTARHNGLRVDSHYDGRLSPVDSTEAALKHLQALHTRFNDWRLTAMAYNAGEHRIQRAMRRQQGQTSAHPHPIPEGLPQVTYDYIAKLRALSCLIAEPKNHGLTLPQQVHFTPLRILELPAGVRSLETIAPQLGTDTATLRRLNPAFRHGRVASNTPRRLLAPANQPVVLTTPTDSVEPSHHTVQRGDTLSGLARRYGVTVNDLLRWNELEISALLRLGQTLRITD